MPAAWVGCHISRIFSSTIGWNSPVTNILQVVGDIVDSSPGKFPKFRNVHLVQCRRSFSLVVVFCLGVCFTLLEHDPLFAYENDDTLYIYIYFDFQTGGYDACLGPTIQVLVDRLDYHNGSSFLAMALRPICRPQLPDCRAFEITDFVRGEEASPTPNARPVGPS
jgi:hypothetical protein